MQKLIGSILVITVCSAMGFQKGRELQQHLNELEGLRKIFALVRSELQYTKAPLAEVLLKISNQTEGIYHNWLTLLAERLTSLQGGTLREVWCDSIERYLEDCQLTSSELEDLREVGKGIGYIETIDLYLNRLDLSIEGTREELKSKKKMYQVLGIMSGLFLVIVLM